MNKKICVIGSGKGSNLQAIIRQIHNPLNVPIDVKMVISNKKDAGILKIAREADIETCLFENGGDDFDKALIKAIPRNIDLIVLAGYNKKLSALFVNRFIGKIINVHPSLLPRHAGTMYAIEEAFKNKKNDKITGVTIHWVDEGLDTGEIIAQDSIRICAEDTLESLTEKIQAKEHVLLPQAIKKHCHNSKPPS